MSAWAVFAADPKPLDYYGRIAQKEMNMLKGSHLLQRPLNAEMSERAWTNLVTHYDYGRMIFRQEDLDGFAPMKRRICDALRSGDVSFGYEVYRVYARRYREFTNFMTNLFATTEFDFSAKEDYLYQRKDEPWPATREEQERLWTQRAKNEMLVLLIGRELDEEAAKKEEAAEKARKDGDKAKEKSDKADEQAADKDEDEPEEPKLSPVETLVKRYRRVLEVVEVEMDEESVLQKYLSAMAQACDPHTDYLSPTSKEDFDMGMSLSLCGVGATLSMDDETGGLKIQEILPGGPMARDKRIKKGDRIVGVGQGDAPIEDVICKPMKKSIRKIRGPKGTKVVLEILPRTDLSGATRKRIALIRDEIKLDEQAATGRVETVVLDGVTNQFGYVKLPSFYGSGRPGDANYRSCSYDVAKYVSSFNEAGVSGVALDLRGNGGGSLPEAILLTALFTHPGPVVQICETRNYYVVPNFPERPTFACRQPMVVLVDHASASASEIVAAALQDRGRAIVTGDTRTHGKGSVQSVMPMGPERYGSMKITTARFFRVNGSSTQVKGVESDVRLPGILDGLDVGEDKLPNALPWSRIERANCRAVWNLPTYAPELRRLSEARVAKSPEWERHMTAVDKFRESAKRKTVPLEYAARLKLVREEREMREAEEADGGDDEESAEEAALAQAENGDRKDDLVLKESFNVLADLVRLVGGQEAPAEPKNRLPAWLDPSGGF